MVEKRLYHSVANQILELIDSGVFPPWSRLPGERDLAIRFGVSRVVIREAEIVLQAQGRIEIKVGSGAYVLDASNKTLDGLPKVGPFELTQARALFEAESAALAAPIITDEALEELEGYVGIMSGQVASSMSTEEADEAFHMTIAQATNNHAIIFAISSMWKMRTEAAKLQTVYKTVTDKDSDGRLLEDEHLNILNALKTRDSSVARQAMRGHFSRMIETLLVASEEAAYAEAKRKASESRSRFTLTQQLD